MKDKKYIFCLLCGVFASFINLLISIIVIIPLIIWCSDINCMYYIFIIPLLYILISLLLFFISSLFFLVHCLSSKKLKKEKIEDINYMYYGTYF